jgi:hypothetical protein
MAGATLRCRAVLSNRKGIDTFDSASYTVVHGDGQTTAAPEVRLGVGAESVVLERAGGMREKAMTNAHNHTPGEEHRIREAALDETVAGSFPASDPPSSLPNPDEHDAEGSGVERAEDPRQRASTADIVVTENPGKKSKEARKRTTAPAQATHDEVARRAYDLFLARGCEHGHDRDDWLQAERELRGTPQGTTRRAKKSPR